MALCLRAMNCADRLKRFIFGNKKRVYAPIKYREPGTPEKNSERLLELIEQDFAPVRDRTDQECMMIGRFMSVVLLIERKLVRLLSTFDPKIDDRMFGQKIEVYKDFLKEFDWQEDDDELNVYRGLIAPMREIKNIRDAMAHDLSKTSIAYSELTQTNGYIKKRRPDLYTTFSSAKDENLRSFGAASVFAFIFSTELAKLQCELE